MLVCPTAPIHSRISNQVSVSVALWGSWNSVASMVRYTDQSACREQLFSVKMPSGFPNWGEGCANRTLWYIVIHIWTYERLDQSCFREHVTARYGFNLQGSITVNQVVTLWHPGFIITPSFITRLYIYCIWGAQCVLLRNELLSHMLDKMGVRSVLWMLMTWCFSTRASVATILTNTNYASMSFQLFKGLMRVLGKKGACWNRIVWY